MINPQAEKTKRWEKIETWIQEHKYWLQNKIFDKKGAIFIKNKTTQFKKNKLRLIKWMKAQEL